MIKKETFQNLTSIIKLDSVVYPGDPTFQIENVCSISHGSSFHLCKMSMSNHLGTHIDFPSHVIQGGKTFNDFSVENFIGDGIIIEVPSNYTAVSKDLIESYVKEIHSSDFVFFKTENSKRISKYGKLANNYVYITTDAAKSLLELNVKVVGIDYISVDSLTDEKLPVHNLLLGNDVLIIENLELGQVKPGKFNVIIAPLNIDGIDGSPATVYARKINQ
ncbi:MAG: cyclase family protein [Legionellales bacterium]|nr:cyclase family protein [Legionellales bacterium]